MKLFAKTQCHETVIYIILWVTVFMIPVLDNYYRHSIGLSTGIQWNDICRVWVRIVPFLVLFLIHNIWLLPHKLMRKKHISYLIFSLLFLGLFSVAHTVTDPHRGKPDHDHKHPEHALPFEAGRAIPEHKGMPDDVPPPMKPHHPHENELIFAPSLISLILAFLMLGLNIGIKYLFKSRQDEYLMKELEKNNLIQELEYLKYQINPHFFMNTLNNIHALIDIDSEKAKSTVIELSRLMRYMLYESSRDKIQLTKEIEFLNHYIALMRLRYCDKVRILFSTPDPINDIAVPPLLFISFVENAFKHGISYQKESFIEIAIKVNEDCLLFTCNNSKHKTSNDSTSGIGLDNVRKRLNLLYGKNYRLEIEDQNAIFEVLLEIPIEYDKVYCH